MKSRRQYKNVIKLMQIKNTYNINILMVKKTLLHSCIFDENSWILSKLYFR